MPGRVNRRNVYDNSKRQAQAIRNRRAVVDACYATLVEEGHQATTLKAVARRAGVSVEMIYKTFGSKPALIKAVYDVTLAGDDEPVPIVQRPEVLQVIETPDPAVKIDLYARMVRSMAERISPLLAALGDAERSLTEASDTERLRGVGGFVGHLAEVGHLRADLDTDEAVETVWMLLSPANYRLLTHDRGWTPDRWERWLARTLKAVLL
jgi:AcrR family transcriptional regulator